MSINLVGVLLGSLAVMCVAGCTTTAGSGQVRPDVLAASGTWDQPAQPMPVMPYAGPQSDPLQPLAGAAADPEPAAAGPMQYTVRRGDTLWKIAVDHYGDGQHWKRIKEANPGLDETRMPVGQPILLP